MITFLLNDFLPALAPMEAETEGFISLEEGNLVPVSPQPDFALLLEGNMREQSDCKDNIKPDRVPTEPPHVINISNNISDNISDSVSIYENDKTNVKEKEESAPVEMLWEKPIISNKTVNKKPRYELDSREPDSMKPDLIEPLLRAYSPLKVEEKIETHFKEENNAPEKFYVEEKQKIEVERVIERTVAKTPERIVEGTIEKVETDFEKENTPTSFLSLLSESHSPPPVMLSEPPCRQGEVLSSLTPTSVKPELVSPSQDVEEKIFNEIKFLIGNEKNKATIEMDPPELGKIEVEIVQDKEETHIVFRVPAENKETKALIENSLTHLTHQLELTGMSLGDVSVSQEDFSDRPQKTPDAKYLTTFSKEEKNSEEKEIITPPSSLHVLDLYV